MAKSFARTFGQDLMRGEHVVGGGQPMRPSTDHTSASASAMALAGGFDSANGHSGTSIFDPVVCELAYRWFCPPGGTILDPFAGGSVRGIVASKLGFPYIGIELRQEQVNANMAQGTALCGVPAPRWVCGDSREILPHMADGDEPVAADFIFSCPPYADLEVYSDDPRDISNMPYAQFRTAYGDIIKAACTLLRNHRFACFVVGDARGKDGNYYGLPWHTVQAFEESGLRLYNESVLVTAIGSLPVRVTKQFEASRKLGKTHQNIFVFVKGDGKKAATACRVSDGN